MATKKAKPKAPVKKVHKSSSKKGSAKKRSH
jgi:hypothetical protein